MTDSEILEFLDGLTKRDAGNRNHHQAEMFFHRNCVTVHIRYYGEHHVITGEGKTVRDAVIAAASQRKPS